MSEMPVPFLLPLLALVGGAVLLLRRWSAMRRTPRASLEIATDGATTVPVHGLYLRRGGIFGGALHNNLNPHFAIAPHGIRFRVFRESLLAFSDIGHVEVRERFGLTYLLFVSGVEPRLLSVSVGNRAIARQVLDALPRTIALTPEAATLREGVSATGTPGLRRYSGRFV